MESSPGGQKTTSVEERLDWRDSMATLSMVQAREAASHMVTYSQCYNALFSSVKATVENLRGRVEKLFPRRVPWMLTLS